MKWGMMRGKQLQAFVRRFADAVERENGEDPHSVVRHQRAADEEMGRWLVHLLAAAGYVVLPLETTPVADAERGLIGQVRP